MTNARILNISKKEFNAYCKNERDISSTLLPGLKRAFPEFEFNGRAIDYCFYDHDDCRIYGYRTEEGVEFRYCLGDLNVFMDALARFSCLSGDIIRNVKFPLSFKMAIQEGTRQRMDISSIGKRWLSIGFDDLHRQGNHADSIDILLPEIKAAFPEFFIVEEFVNQDMDVFGYFFSSRSERGMTVGNIKWISGILDDLGQLEKDTLRLVTFPISFSMNPEMDEKK